MGERGKTSLLLTQKGGGSISTGGGRVFLRGKGGGEGPWGVLHLRAHAKKKKTVVLFLPAKKKKGRTEETLSLATASNLRKGWTLALRCEASGKVSLTKRKEEGRGEKEGPV